MDCTPYEDYQQMLTPPMLKLHPSLLKSQNQLIYHSPAKILPPRNDQRRVLAQNTLKTFNRPIYINYARPGFDLSQTKIEYMIRQEPKVIGTEECYKQVPMYSAYDKSFETAPRKEIDNDTEPFVYELNKKRKKETINFRMTPYAKMMLSEEEENTVNLKNNKEHLKYHSYKPGYITKSNLAIINKDLYERRDSLDDLKNLTPYILNSEN